MYPSNAMYHNILRNLGSLAYSDNNPSPARQAYEDWHDFPNTNTKNTKIEEYINEHTHNNEDNTECSICLQENHHKHKFVKTKCDHVFHKRCLAKWINTKNTCPLCRNNIL